MDERICDECHRTVKRIRLGKCDSCYQRARLRGLRAVGKAPECAVDDCSDPVVARGYCNTHYLRFQKYGHTDKVRVTRDGCSVNGCDKPHFGLGYCRGHHARVRKHGDPQAHKPLKAKKGAGSGYLDAKGYRILPGGQKEHRAVMEQMIGRPLHPDERVHHKNGVRDDNRPGNLELWVLAHPAGARVEDVVMYAEEMLRRYRPDLIAS